MSAESIADKYLAEIRSDVLGFVEAGGHGSLNLCFQDGRLVMVDSNRKRKIAPVVAGTFVATSVRILGNAPFV